MDAYELSIYKAKGEMRTDAETKVAALRNEIYQSINIPGQVEHSSSSDDPPRNKKMERHLHKYLTKMMKQFTNDINRNIDDIEELFNKLGKLD